MSAASSTPPGASSAATSTPTRSATRRRRCSPSTLGATSATSCTPAVNSTSRPYRNIGEGFAHVEKVEAFCAGAGAGDEPGRALRRAARGLRRARHVVPHRPDEGACVMLLENQLDFEGVTPRESRGQGRGDRHPALPHPRGCAEARGLRRGRREGRAPRRRGAAARRGRGGAGPGAELRGTGALQDRLLARRRGAPLARRPGHRAVPSITRPPRVTSRPTAAARRCSPTIREPYFDRTYANYTSHQETPYRLEDAGHVARRTQGQRRRDRSHPLGKMYSGHGARQHRELFSAVLDALGHEPNIALEGLRQLGPRHAVPPAATRSPRAAPDLRHADPPRRVRGHRRPAPPSTA